MRKQKRTVTLYKDVLVNKREKLRTIHLLLFVICYAAFLWAMT